jgi:CheY-like chemotaxis protein
MPQALTALTILVGRDDQQQNFLSAAGALTGNVLWPGIILYAVFLFEPQLRTLLDRLGHGDVSVKVGGFEVQLKRATLALTAAGANRPEENFTAGIAADVIRISVPDEASLAKLAEARVLWVDDQPQNNRFERLVMQRLGLTVDLSTSTDDALTRLQLDSYDLVISDMSRPPDLCAGFSLLDSIRDRNDRTPFLIYSSSRSPEQSAEAIEHGAIGYTNRPTELTILVTGSILGTLDMDCP